jgi:hypothetical protein
VVGVASPASGGPARHRRRAGQGIHLSRSPGPALRGLGQPQVRRALRLRRRRPPAGGLLERPHAALAGSDWSPGKWPTPATSGSTAPRSRPSISPPCKCPWKAFSISSAPRSVRRASPPNFGRRCGAKIRAWSASRRARWRPTWSASLESRRAALWLLGAFLGARPGGGLRRIGRRGRSLGHGIPNRARHPHGPRRDFRPASSGRVLAAAWRTAGTGWLLSLPASFLVVRVAARLAAGFRTTLRGRRGWPPPSSILASVTLAALSGRLARGPARSGPIYVRQRKLRSCDEIAGADERPINSGSSCQRHYLRPSLFIGG